MALDQYGKLWLGLNFQHPLREDKKWLSYLYAQFRFIDRSHPWEATLVEGGIGNLILPGQTIWLGYRWSGHNPNNGFYQLHRLFQQYILVKPLDGKDTFVTRMRLEEIMRSDKARMSLRYRQRFTLDIKKSFLFARLFPFLYEEIFFSLNRNNSQSQTFVSENRVFIGFNLITSKETWWEIGYINQYLWKTPRQPQNQMNHVLSINWNF